MSVLTIDQGDHEAIDVVAKKPDNTAQPLGGCKLWFYVKAGRNDPDSAAVLAKDSDDPAKINITDAVGGLAEVLIVPADTANLDEAYLGENLLWQLKLKDSADKIVTLARGNFLIKKNIIQTTA